MQQEYDLGTVLKDRYVDEKHLLHSNYTRVQVLMYVKCMFVHVCDMDIGEACVSQPGIPMMGMRPNLITTPWYTVGSSNRLSVCLSVSLFLCQYFEMSSNSSLLVVLQTYKGNCSLYVSVSSIHLSGDRLTLRTITAIHVYGQHTRIYAAFIGASLVIFLTSVFCLPKSDANKGI